VTNERVRLRAGAFILGAALAACSEVTFSGGEPVSLEIAVDKATAAIGEDVAVSVDARGTSLNGVVVEYGDGVADSLSAFGAVSAQTTFVHRYQEVGTYVVRGRAEDGPTGTARDSATVVVTGGG
jgi:hypothetical protein